MEEKIVRKVVQEELAHVTRRVDELRDAVFGVRGDKDDTGIKGDVKMLKSQMATIEAIGRRATSVAIVILITIVLGFGSVLFRHLFEAK